MASGVAPLRGRQAQAAQNDGLILEAAREVFLADPTAAMDELGLGAEERAALLPIDRDILVGRGAHPYLVFMAELRLRLAREPGAHEHF